MKYFCQTCLLLLVLFIPLNALSQSSLAKVRTADNGDGTYNNPILHADYSDPDVVRVGGDYYMTASSFNCVPGLPVLHSEDLVHWELIGHALDRLIPEDVFSVPQHGNGVWAPCIRYHNKEFYIYYPDPDFGIYMVKATDPHGPWSDPVLVKGGKGLIDPSPLWDGDDRVYLTYAFAGSRAGIKSVIMVTELSPDGTRQTGEDVMVFDGHGEHPTVEGPKFYKRDGYYYIFAPAGGVSRGWQLVLRATDIYGPYEEKVVLAQGASGINGPHQGAWIDTPSGEEHWFIHFQDKEAYGRIVHLQPMKWVNGWPVIGSDADGDGTGEPVLSFRKPDIAADFAPVSPPESDEFDGDALGLQWQWHANPDLYYGFPSGNLGFLRLNCIPRPENEKGLWNRPNLLLQKFPAEKFTATTSLTFNSYKATEEAGFVIMGEDYQYISLQCIDGSYSLRVVRCKDARTGGSENVLFSEPIDQNRVFFRIRVGEGAICSFSYSLDGKRFTEVGDSFHARPGRWIGAKIGYFAVREGITNDSGTVDIDWIRFE
ncbi:MAG: glycoside hydrolase 43 family protein [Bacteroidales bacterium]|nr:glycoside hydrolase 43 family protein [Bacteroidales bacterium]MDT8430967.1 glycoside hydrolase 43 family protein [Bacteroidales bacterium]